MPPIFKNCLTQVNDILSLLNMLIPFFANKIKATKNNNPLAMMLVTPIPLTPRLAETDNEEIKNISKTTHKTSFIPVNM